MNSESWKYSAGNQLEMHQARHYRDQGHRLIVQLPEIDNLMEVRVVELSPQGDLVRLFHAQSFWSMWFPCYSVFVVASIPPPPKPKVKRVRAKPTKPCWNAELLQLPPVDEKKKLTRRMLEQIWKDMTRDPETEPDDPHTTEE